MKIDEISDMTGQAEASEAAPASSSELAASRRSRTPPDSALRTGRYARSLSATLLVALLSCRAPEPKVAEADPAALLAIATAALGEMRDVNAYEIVLDAERRGWRRYESTHPNFEAHQPPALKPILQQRNYVVYKARPKTRPGQLIEDGGYYIVVSRLHPHSAAVVLDR